MSKVNSIAICRDNYNSKAEWEDAIKKMVVALLENRQVMTIRFDEPGLGIVAIEFDCDDQELGGNYPYWLSPDEYMSIEFDEEKKSRLNNERF